MRLNILTFPAGFLVMHPVLFLTRRAAVVGRFAPTALADGPAGATDHAHRRTSEVCWPAQLLQDGVDFRGDEVGAEDGVPDLVVALGEEVDEAVHHHLDHQALRHVQEHC